MSLPLNLKNLRRICFRECYAEAQGVDCLPPGEDECCLLDFWFEFEGCCLAFTHEKARFFPVKKPPQEAEPIPTSADEMETDCLPECFLGATLLSILAEEEPGFILRFDNGGIIELSWEPRCFSAEGPANYYWTPHFYSAAWLADEENAATRAYTDEEITRNREVALANAAELSEAENAAPAPQEDEDAEWADEETGEATDARRSVTDFVSDLRPRERAWLEHCLRPGEYVRWATRPYPAMWGGASPAFFFMGVLALLYLMPFFNAALEALQAAASQPNFALNALRILAYPLLFACPVLWLITSPLRHQWRLSHTLYIITSERALVTCATPFSRSWQRWELAPGMVKDSHNVPDGRGRILFSLDPAGFFYLPNMERAHRELRRALQAGKKNKKLEAYGGVV